MAGLSCGFTLWGFGYTDTSAHISTLIGSHTAPSGLDLVLIVCVGTLTSRTYNHSLTKSGLSVTATMTAAFLIFTGI